MLAERMDRTAADIQLADGVLCFDLAFHPLSDNVLAAALIDGSISLFEFSESQSRLLGSLQAHRSGSSCREVAFDVDGSRLFSVGSDSRLCCFQTADGGGIVKTAEYFHPTMAGVRRRDALSFNALQVCAPGLVACGDDDGWVSVFDLRQKNPVAHLQTNSDFVADLSYDEASHQLFVAAGDGRLSVVNTKYNRHVSCCDSLDDELLSVEVVRRRDGSKYVVVGCQDGSLNAFTWGHFSWWKERQQAVHSMSITGIRALPQTPSLFVSCGGDGLVRLCSCEPLSSVDVVGDHGDFPVECLDLSPSGTVVASASHDSRIRFWDVSSAVEYALSGASAAILSTEDGRGRGRHRGRGGPRAASRTRASFFGGLQDSQNEEMSGGSGNSDGDSDDGGDSDGSNMGDSDPSD